MKISLNLVRSPDISNRQVAGWFLVNGQWQSWLQNYEHKMASMSLQIRVVPDRHAPLQPLGLLVTGCESVRGFGGLPYRRRGALFMPLDAEVAPAASDGELRALLDRDSIDEFVWHPTAGLIGFESDQILTLDRLLGPAAQTAADWSRARPGAHVSRRLLSIDPEQTMTIEQLLTQAADDIGTESNLDDLPESSDEAPPDLGEKAANIIRQPVARAINWFANRSPGASDDGTWIRNMADWANRVLNRTTAIQSNRSQQLRRLLEMLQRDPDRGLRHAIPFGGEPHRGIAPPGDQLGTYHVDFSLHGPIGPADPWEMPWQIRARLEARYRDLAVRETNLGRHRRAAYIYASLLNDYPSAAKSLERGLHFAEAAVVYQDKLRQPREAARCWERAGRWSRAVTLYEQHDEWEKVAELHERLDHREPASQAWRRAAASCMSDEQFRRAAEICEEKLSDTDTAAECLVAGWERSREPGACLKQLLALYGRHELHDRALERIEGVEAGDQAPTVRQAAAASTFADCARQYPDAAVRDRALRSVRRIAARNLVSGQSHRVVFLTSVAQLAPNDRLLARDCERFTRLPGRRSRPPRAGFRSVIRGGLRSDVHWEEALVVEQRLFVAGFCGDSELVLAEWNPKTPQLAPDYSIWNVPPAEFRALDLLPSGEDERPVVLQVYDIGRKDLSRKSNGVGRKVMNLPFEASATLAATVLPNGVYQALETDGAYGLLLRVYSRRGLPLAGYTIPPDIVARLSALDASALPLMAGIGNRVCVALDDQLIVMDPSEKQRSLDEWTTQIDLGPAAGNRLFVRFPLGQPVHGLAGCASRQDPRLAITMSDGGVVHWLETDQQQPFGFGLVDPVAAFTQQNDLVVADQNGTIEIYETEGNSIQLSATKQIRRSQVGAIVALGPVQFAICFSDGVVDVFEYRR